LNNDGEFDDATGPNPTLSWADLKDLGIDDGPDTHEIRLRVDDGQGNIALSEPIILTVENVAPQIAISGPDLAVLDAEYDLSLGEITDPGNDTVTQWIVDWGDGTSESFDSAGLKLHTYTDPGDGSYQIVVDIVDEDGTVAGAAVLQVDVQQGSGNVPGDANGDGAVNLADFNALKNNFGGSGGLSQGDFTGDNLINLADFNILKENFGRIGPPPTQIPGDTNGDKQVNLVDFNVVKNNFGGSGSLAEGDLDGDGQINLVDFNILKENFGRSGSVDLSQTENSRESTEAIDLVLGQFAQEEDDSDFEPVG